MQKPLFALLFLCTSLIAFSQNGTIKGKITENSDANGLYGVNIIVKGSTLGTISGDNGMYSLSVPEGHQIVEYSFIGLENQSKTVSIKAGETVVMNINMAETVNELDIFVVSASKYKKKLGEELVSMEVISQERINSANFKLDDALNRVPGFQMLGESPSIRGGNGFAAGSASRVLFMLDGLPVLRPDNGEIFYEILPLENVQQIEIIKGAASALYGSAAMNGIVNVITANPRNEPVTKLIANYGFYQKFGNKNYTHWWDSKTRAYGEGSLVHMKKYKNFDVSLGANHWQDRSYLQENERKRSRLNMRFRFFPKNNKNLTLGVNSNLMHQSGGAFFLWAGIDSLILTPRTFATNRSRTINIDPYLLYFDKKNNQHSLKTRIFSIFHEASEGALAHTTQYLGDYSFLKQYDSGFNLTTGATGYYTNTNSVTFGDHTASNIGAFVQMDKKFFDRLTLSGGLRFEYFSVDTLETENEIKLFEKDDGSHPTIPVKPVIRFGSSVQITKATFLRASYAQAYRFPTIAELFVKTPRSGTFSYPNPTLVPETGWTMEVGLKQQFRVSDWVAYLDVAGFMTRYYDMMEFTFGRWGTAADPDLGFGFRANNVGNAKITGFEISSFGQGNIFGLPLDFQVGYTYIDPKNQDYDPDRELTSDNNPLLKYRIKHTAKASVDVTYKKFSFGVNGFYNSFMDNVDDFITAIDGVVAFRETNYGGDLILDSRLGFTISEEASVNLLFKNLTNEDYTLRPGFLEPPRNYTFQVMYNL